MTDTPNDDERERSTEPAEGAEPEDVGTTTSDPRERPQEPAEGDV